MAAPAVATEIDICLCDSRDSIHCTIARMALIENNVAFESIYLSIQDGAHLTPDYARLNAKMTLPALMLREGSIGDSRQIVQWAYSQSSTKESDHERDLLDALYSIDVGKLAWLTGKETIPLLALLEKSGVMKSNQIERLRKLQREDPEMQEVYEKKIAAIESKVMDDFAAPCDFSAIAPRSRGNCAVMTNR
jgi:glutathione S-transferase